MKKFTIAVLGSVITLCVSSTAMADAQCQKLQDDYDVIYASKGFCFKDPAKQARFDGQNCSTNKPKFSEKEQQRLDQIKVKQKELNCN